jgi:hypothetical protein
MAFQHANPNARFLRDGAVAPAVDPYAKPRKPKMSQGRNPFEMGL